MSLCAHSARRTASRVKSLAHGFSDTTRQDAGQSQRAMTAAVTHRPTLERRVTGARGCVFSLSALGGRLREALQTPRKLPVGPSHLPPAGTSSVSVPCVGHVATPFPEPRPNSWDRRPQNHVHPNPRFRRNRAYASFAQMSPRGTGRGRLVGREKEHKAGACVRPRLVHSSRHVRREPPRTQERFLPGDSGALC